MSKENHDYWEQRAKDYLGEIDVMTSNDLILASLEVKALIAHFAGQPVGQRILEVGCGSGRIIKTLAEEFPEETWYGIDYSATMIDQATKLHIPNTSFEVADMLRWCAFTPFDQIFFVRSLTNLASLDEQIEVLDRMQLSLTPDGSLILLEPTIQGLEQVNILREQLDLEPMKSAWFNCYLDLPVIIQQLECVFTNVQVKQFSATYCLASRVLNAAQAKQQGEEPSYFDHLNKISASIDQTTSNVSTHVMIMATR